MWFISLKFIPFIRKCLEIDGTILAKIGQIANFARFSTC